MWRAAKVSQIVREEMNATGAQSVCCRNSSQLNYGANPVAGIPTPKLRGIMFALTDRQKRELGLDQPMKK